MKTLLYLILFFLFSLSAAAAEPAVEFARLDTNRGHVECPAADVCRVRRVPSVEELRTHLDAGEKIWRNGDELSFVWEGEAEGVELAGGIQYPMSRVVGTNLWTLTVRVPQLDRAIITYGFMAMKGGEPVARRFEPMHWRGPAAPAAVEKVQKLAGTIVNRKIESKAMGETRELMIYEPPARNGEPLAGVIYAGDGGAVDTFARVIEPLIIAGRVPRILMVGFISSPTSLGRAQEYLLTLEDDNAIFLKHEKFFLSEVIPAIERDYQLPEGAAHRATFGFSNSAAWAMDMALRHPDLIGRVLAFSPAGRKATLLEPLPKQAPSFFLLGGTLEKPFHDKAIAWGEVLAGLNVKYTTREPVAGHDFEAWLTYFGEAVQWAFGGQAQTAQR
jgi:enterochelin esterase-like enzyme